MLMIAPLYVVSGFGVGLLVGMTGVGGGSLMTPLLILLFGIHPATAVGTDLLYALPRWIIVEIRRRVLNAEEDRREEDRWSA